MRSGPLARTSGTIAHLIRVRVRVRVVGLGLELG